jgi:hypothetical protein
VNQALIGIAGKQSRLLKIRDHLCRKPRDGIAVPEILNIIERELRLPQRSSRSSRHRPDAAREAKSVSLGIGPQRE